MRKLFLLLWLTLSLQLTAQVSDHCKLRYFMSSGEIIDLNATDIDSITHNAKMQLVWMPDTCLRILENNIDSVIYMSPMLQLKTSSLNFGKVAVGNGRTLAATLTNVGDYMEHFTLMGDNNFTVKGNYRELTLGAGLSIDIEMTFSPTDSIDYNGWLLLYSNSIDNGKQRIPLIGQGVHSPTMEEDADEPPAEQTFNILLPEDTNLDDLEGFKIVNIHGEFETNLPSQARSACRVKLAGQTQQVYGAGAVVSQNAPQLNFLVDKDGNPWLYGISFPGGMCEMSYRSTAMSILMCSPYLITNSEAEQKNVENLIYKLKSFDNFVDEVAKEYRAAQKEQRGPDYANLNPFPVFNELFNLVKNNTEQTLGGISIRDLSITPEKVKLKLHNDFKRNALMFPSIVKMNEANLVVTERKALLRPLKEVIFDLLEEAIKKLAEDRWKETLGTDDEWQIIVLEDIKAMLDKIEEDTKTSIEDVPSEDLTPFPFPYFIESGKTDYFDIVWDAVFKEDQDKSIFEWDSEEIELAHGGFDKVCLDIYGLGLPNGMKWNDFSTEDKERIILSFIYGGYKNIFEPLWKMITGISKSCKKTVVADPHYSSQKAPELALLAKLFYDFAKDRKNIFKLGEYIEKGKYADAAKHVLKFVVMKFPSKIVNDDEKPSYIDLLYNIVRDKYVRPHSWQEYESAYESVKSYQKFRDTFIKKLTPILQVINTISTTIDATEKAVDLIGAADAILKSEIKQSFYIDTYRERSIVIKEPTSCYFNSDVEVHFEWEANKREQYGPWAYDLEMITETVSEIKQTIVKSGITDTQYDYNVASLPGAATAVRIYFRIIGRHPDNPSAIYAMSDMILLVERLGALKVGPEMIDLGLPSGTRWATCNLGAKSMYDIGDYYAWGETMGFDEGKKGFSWKNYRWSNGSPDKLTKYCTRKSYGNVDNKKSLEATDDIVKSSYGYYYSIPTREDWEELCTCCNWMWQNDNFVIVRGPNGQFIVLPMTGYRSGLNIYDNGTEGQYWSSTIDENSPDDAWFLYVKNIKGTPHEMNSYYRCQGRSIRPVLHDMGIIPPITTISE